MKEENKQVRTRSARRLLDDDYACERFNRGICRVIRSEAKLQQARRNASYNSEYDKLGNWMP